MGEQVSERESLAEALHPATCSMPGVCTLPFGNQDLHAADAALAWFAEHRAPRVVSTVEELDALPVRSVVRDPHGRAFEKFSDGWAAAGLAGAHDVCARPATVPLTPTTESEDR